MKLNSNFQKIQQNYLFLTIAEKVNEYIGRHPENSLIRMGIGDVTMPLADEVISAMQSATLEMAHKDTFKGYPPDQGYDFLRQKINNYYKKRNVGLSLSEIFVGDGAKSDIGNILDIFDTGCKVLIPDPVYPVYVDTNIMAGRNITYIDANEGNDFLPVPNHNIDTDIIYLCSPNNPTGAVYNKDQLKKWVDYALEKQAVILFDAAYEAFISDEKLPRSIFEIDGAGKCAIEFCSFSKTAGFTGMRCGYTVVPEALVYEDVSVNKLWARRQATKFNGVNYVTQRAAEAVFSKKGSREIAQTIDYYRANATVMVEAFKELGLWFTGGSNSPYIWLKCPDNMTSWDFFDYLLNNAEVVGTPGSGFGNNGKGYFRLTAFGDKEKTKEAMERIKKLLK